MSARQSAIGLETADDSFSTRIDLASVDVHARADIVVRAVRIDPARSRHVGHVVGSGRLVSALRADRPAAVAIDQVEIARRLVHQPAAAMLGLAAAASASTTPAQTKPDILIILLPQASVCGLVDRRSHPPIVDIPRPEHQRHLPLAELFASVKGRSGRSRPYLACAAAGFRRGYLPPDAVAILPRPGGLPYAPLRAARPGDHVRRKSTLSSGPP